MEGRVSVEGGHHQVHDDEFADDAEKGVERRVGDVRALEVEFHVGGCGAEVRGDRLADDGGDVVAVATCDRTSTRRSPIRFILLDIVSHLLSDCNFRGWYTLVYQLPVDRIDQEVA